LYAKVRVIGGMRIKRGEGCWVDREWSGWKGWWEVERIVSGGKRRGKSNQGNGGGMRKRGERSWGVV